MGLLTGGRVFFQGHFRELDVVWDNQGVIQELAPHGLYTPSADEEHYDARGREIIPGLVDAQVAFHEPVGRGEVARREGWTSGSAGALHGAVTSVLEISASPPYSVDASSYSARIARATGRSHVDFGLYPSLVERSATHLRDMAPLAPGFHLVMYGANLGERSWDHGLMRELFQAAGAAGRQVVVQAEDPAILAADGRAHPAEASAHHLRRSAAAETVAIAAAIEMAADAECEVHFFQVSTARGVDLIDEAKRHGLPVSGSTCAQYLLFTHDDVAARGNELVAWPSIKGPRDRRRLLEGVDSGAIEIVTSGHQPCSLAQKRAPYAETLEGIPGVDLFYPLLHHISRREGILLPKLLEAATHHVAETFCLMQKGEIEIGNDADLVVLAPPGEERVIDASELPSASDFSPWAGLRLRTGIECIFLRGERVMEKGKKLGRPRGKPIAFEVPRYWA
jgi:dihydroorotase-like cyclic amidohydrolase